MSLMIFLGVSKRASSLQYVTLPSRDGIAFLIDIINAINQ